MSFFSNLFSMGVPGMMGLGQRRNPNPAEAANPYLAQVPALAQQHLAPYLQRGTQGDNNATNAYYRSYNEYANPANVYPQEYNNPEGIYPAEYTQMGQNPVRFVEDIMRNYEPSRGYNYKQNRMLQAMRNSAASGGFAGTEIDRENQANLVREMLGQDMQEFLGNILGVQQHGLAGRAAGIEKGLAGRERGLERGLLGRERAQARLGEMGERQATQGFGAATSLADILSGNASERAGLAFQGQRQRNEDRNQQNQQRQNFMSNLIGLGMGGFGFGR